MSITGKPVTVYLQIRNIRPEITFALHKVRFAIADVCQTVSPLNQLMYCRPRETTNNATEISKTGYRTFSIHNLVYKSKANGYLHISFL